MNRKISVGKSSVNWKALDHNGRWWWYKLHTGARPVGGNGRERVTETCLCLPSCTSVSAWVSSADTTRSHLVYYTRQALCKCEYSCVRADVRKCHKPGGLEQQTYIYCLAVLQAACAKWRSQQGWGLLRGSEGEFVPCPSPSFWGYLQSLALRGL